MAISPELKPSVTLLTDSDYELPPKTSSAREALRDRSEKTGGSMGYILGVIILIAAGYFTYTYYAPTTIIPTSTDQSAPTVTPATPVPSAVAPAVPATPPAGTTTP